jgi:probable O-glycosylation ligase (exosortase A-associated)
MLKINSIVPLAVTLGVIFHDSINNNKKIFSHSNTKLFLFLLFLLIVSVLLSDVTQQAYKILKSVLGYVLWFYIITRIITDIEKVKGVFKIFVISHIVLLILNPDVVLDPATRTYITGNAFLGDGNDFALSVSLVLPMCLFLVLDAENKTAKILYIIALAALIFAIIGTQSRGASLALMGSFAYLWWMGRQKIIGLVLIFTVVIAVIAFAPPVYFERMNTIKNYETEGSAMGRILAWKSAIRMASAYPVTGVGAGHFAIKLGTEFRPPEFGGQNLPWLTAHSSYFLILGELGLPGILYFLALLIINYRKNNKYLKFIRKKEELEEDDIRYKKLFLMLNASLVAFAIGGAFLSVTYYPHIFVLAGLFASVELMYLSRFNKTDEVSNDEKPKNRYFK